MSEITNSEEQKTVQDPKKEILEELFGAVHEYADGTSSSIHIMIMALRCGTSKSLPYFHHINTPF